MASITLRSSLSRGLTNSEVDDNFTNLNNDKAENGANSDITSMSGVTGEIGDPTQIQFNVQASHPAYSEGLLWYDSIHNTLNYYGDESGLVHEIGLEEHQKIYNNSGVTINKGEPLYFSGNFNGYPTAAKANATDVNKYNAQGIAAHSIENGTYGYVCTAGLVEDVDTSGLSSGTNFFVGLTDGAVQNASPTYPNFPMCLGWVVNSDATNGILLVNQQNHSVNSFRVRTDTHIGGDLIIDGNLTVVGEQTSVGQTNVTQGAPFLRLNEGNAIGESGTTFTGSGLDDAFFSGHFTGTAAQTYYVRIDSVGGGTGGVDTFEVAVGTDSTFQNPILTGVDITGDPQLIHSTDNISVEFGSTTGHTLNDSWSGTASPIDADTGIWTNRNTGTTGVGYTHMGMYFDVSDSKFRLVDEYDPVPTGTIDTLDSSYSAGTLIVDGLEATSATVGGNAVLTTASSNINADTVDGLQASQFLRSDANDGTSSQITLYGTAPFLFAPTAQGMSYNATENGGTANSRYFLRFDRTNNASYPYLTNRTPSGDVAVFTGGATAGTENEIIRFKGGNGTRAIELTNSYFDMGTNDITDTKVGQWDTAYGWGDHSTQGYLTSYTDTNTTYSISAETVNNGANLRLTDSGSTTDDVSIIGGTNVTVARTNADTITISATDTDTTYNNATTSSDGLMSSTDKSKLDGIESGATADQTASEILTAIKTVDGSGSGLDADTLDGNHASAFVSASGGTMTGDLVVNASASLDELSFNKSLTKRFSTYYTGTNYITAGEYQKIATITPSGSSQNTYLRGIITAQSGSNIQECHFVASLRSNTLPDLDFTIVYHENLTSSSRYIDLQLWTKETSPASFVLVAKGLSTIYGNITADFEFIPRFISQDSTISVNEDPTSEVSSIDTGFTANDFTKITQSQAASFDVTGNITVSGTVDGRDLATDGAKLDGIEAGATADQTASEIRSLVESATDSNVFTDADHSKLNGIEAGATADQTASEILTAIKTVDGSGSGLDADTVDGIEASSFLRSDATDTATGALTFGNTLTLNGSYTGGYPLIRLTSGSSSFSRIQFGTAADVDEGIIQYDPAQNHFDFTVGAVNRFRMEADGDFHADGDVIAYSTTISDRRLKTNIKNIDDAVEKVKQLNGCTFNRHDGQASAGVIAQDVEAVLPEAIREKELPLHLANDHTTYKLVEYDAIIGLLVESVKELTARVEDLENAASDNR